MLHRNKINKVVLQKGALARGCRCTSFSDNKILFQQGLDPNADFAVVELSCNV